MDVNEGNSYAGYYFKLLANLNMNNLKWTPIGQEGKPFSGNFNGNGKTVDYLTSYGNYIGLFGYTYNATIENLTVWSFGTGEIYAGGIIGYANATNITNCTSTGKISSYKYAGGIIGYSLHSSVKNSHSGATIDGSYCTMGGIIGYSNESDVTNCYNVGTMQGSAGKKIGGLIGYNSEKSTIMNSYNKGNFKNNGIMKNNSTIGGIVGVNYGKIENCYNSGNIEVENIEYAVHPWIGGIIGSSNASSVVSSCFFLKKHPINSYLNLIGGAQIGGVFSVCGTFDESGVFSESISYHGRLYETLGEILNSWVSNNQIENSYMWWDTSTYFPRLMMELKE